MTKKQPSPPAPKPELTREKSEAIAEFLAGILRQCDVLLMATKTDVIRYLEQFQEEAKSRKYVQMCLAYNQYKDEKLELEMETLDAVVTLLRVRKKQAERMRELKQEEDSTKEFQDFITSLI